MRDINKQNGSNYDVVRSIAAGDGKSKVFPIHPGWPLAELEPRECGLPHAGSPHPVYHETEDERKNRLSAQRIEHARARLLPNRQKCIAPLPSTNYR